MISYVEKIKTDEELIQMPHTKMKYYIDGGFIICKDIIDVYTFIKVDDIEAFNYDMIIEKEYITDISHLEEQYEKILSTLISFDEEFNGVSAITIINDDLFLKHNDFNVFYKIPLKDITEIMKYENKADVINAILEFNQYRDILSPYTVSFENNTLFVC